MAYYFAYGSNVDETQMKSRCPESEIIGKAYLPDYKLGFTRFSQKRQSSVADILVSPDDLVWGLVFKVSNKDIEKLDGFEGVPNFYRRIQETVQLYKSPDISELSEWVSKGEFLKENEEHFNNPENFEGIDCFTYEVVNKNSNLSGPKLEYLKQLINGAIENNFPDYYLEFLKSFSKDDILKKNSEALYFFTRLLDLIKSNKFQEVVEKTREWGGAGLVITGKPQRKEQLAKNYPDDVVVLTPHWQELSWLVQSISLNGNIRWMIDHINKDYFFKEMGKAAIGYQKEHDKKESSYLGICDALLIKAYTLFT